jgi:hypothetical protein
MDCIIKEVAEIKLHPNNMKKEDGFCLITSWKPLISTLKKASLTGFSSSMVFNLGYVKL